jgi:hypothetical protein
MPSYCSACRPEYPPIRSHGSGQALLHHIRPSTTAPDPHVKTPVVKLHGAPLQSVVVLGERRALTKRDDTPPVTEISHFEKALDLLV